jgi:hypothetical protein
VPDRPGSSSSGRSPSSPTVVPRDVRQLEALGYKVTLEPAACRRFPASRLATALTSAPGVPSARPRLIFGLEHAVSGEDGVGEARIGDQPIDHAALKRSKHGPSLL